MVAYDNLSVDHDDGVATVTLDSAAGRNALTLEMANELVSVATTLGENPDTRCIVLTHAGDFFGSGADLSALSGDGSDAAHIRELAGRAHEAIVQFHRAETPVVGGVNGIAAGIGFSLALFPDLLVLGEDATLKFAYPGIGLTGDGGATFFLPRLVGLRTAKNRPPGRANRPRRSPRVGTGQRGRPCRRLRRPAGYNRRRAGSRANSRVRDDDPTADR